MRPEAFISSKLFSSLKTSISSAITHIAVWSVAVGLAVMMISVAVVIGFKNQIREKVTGFMAEASIKPLNNNFSAEATPFFLTEALEDSLNRNSYIHKWQRIADKGGIIRAEEAMLGVILKGVGSDYDWSYFSNRLEAGALPVFPDSVAGNEVLISTSIASKLGLTPGQSLRMWFVDSQNQQPRARRFTVCGIYETGLAEYDDRFVFGDIRHVQKLYNWQPNQYGEVEIRLKDARKLHEFTDDLYFKLPAELTLQTTEETNPQIFDWLELQDVNVWVILILMVFVSGITMVSTLLILILERTAAIGLLKALGANNAFVRHIFLLQSYRLLWRGMLIGNLFALTFIFLQNYFGWLSLPEESYYLSKVPVELNFWHFALINMGVFVSWSLALFIPISVVNAVEPSKSIRFG